MMRPSSFLTVTAAAFLLIPTLAFADELATASDLDLIEQSRDAVEAQDSARVLDLLTEMKRRGSGIFSGAEKAVCEDVITFPEGITDWRFTGAVRQAYVTAAKEVRLADGRCGCLFADYPFSKFTGEVLGKDPSDLVDEDRAALDAFLALRRREAEEDYRAFATLCRAM